MDKLTAFLEKVHGADRRFIREIAATAEDYDITGEMIRYIKDHPDADPPAITGYLIEIICGHPVEIGEAPGED
ncbi:MAG: hypothetical protein LIO81_02390 [Clostridiales bacterium]|nr:hypothetical protein [Clostridiales bacterium]